MTESANMETTYIEEAQANAHISINDFINRFDSFTHIAVIDRDLTAPPGGESDGDVYLVATSPTGDWAGQGGKLAAFYSGWIFQTINAGMQLYIIDEDLLLLWDGNCFVKVKNGIGAIDGFSLSSTTAATASIAIGEATDSTGKAQIELSSLQVVDITASGANGLDTGSEASDTWYYIFVIRNPVTDVVAGLISASATSPTLPSGYTQFRRIGVVYNDSGSNFLEFIQRGAGKTRRYWYDEETSVIEALTDGSAVTFTEIDLSGLVPPVSDNVILFCMFASGTTPGAAGDEVLLRPNGSSVAQPGWRIIAQVTSDTVYADRYMEMPTEEGGQVIEYICDRAANDLTVRVLGFDDEI